MEADIQRRSESRTDGSAASCSRAEKRPLNNNILINAPLPDSVASGSNRWRDYWKLGRRAREQGPSWPRPIGPPFTVCFRCVLVGGVWLWALRASWSPPTMKAAEAGGPSTGNDYQRSYLTSVTIINSPNNKLLFPFHSVSTVSQLWLFGAHFSFEKKKKKKKSLLVSCCESHTGNITTTSNVLPQTRFNTAKIHTLTFKWCLTVKSWIWQNLNIKSKNKSCPFFVMLSPQQIFMQIHVTS